MVIMSLYCSHSFYFVKEAFWEDFLPSNFLKAVRELIFDFKMGDLIEKVLKFANDHPIQFVALLVFCCLGGVPLVVFLVYAVATVIASIIGAVVLELILIGIGITGLAFVLFFVTCITTCATAIFMAVYYSYQVANSTWKHTGGKAFRQSGLWPSSSSHSPPTDDSLDKNK